MFIFVTWVYGHVFSIFLAMNSEEKKAIQIALEDKQANCLKEWYDEREKFLKGNSKFKSRTELYKRYDKIINMTEKQYCIYPGITRAELRKDMPVFVRFGRKKGMIGKLNSIHKSQFHPEG